MRLFVLGFLLLSLFVVVGLNQSCANQTKISSSAVVPKKLEINEKKFAYITKVCAPWDGPALTILVTDSPQDCKDIKTPYLRVTIWKDISEVSGKEFSFPNEKLGIVSRQLSKDKYVVAKSATVRFEKSNDKSEVVFEIDAEFEDGEKVKDAFKARWCESQMRCG